MNDITWHCPKCRAANKTRPEHTSHPKCGGCRKRFDWGAIAHTSDDLAIYLSAVDAVSLKTCGVIALDLIDDQDAGIACLKDCFSNSLQPVKALIKLRELAA